MAARSETGSWINAYGKAWEPIGIQGARDLVERNLSAFEKAVSFRQRHSKLRFLYSENILLYSLYPDEGLIEKRFHTFGVEPKILEALGMAVMKDHGLKEDLAEEFTSIGDFGKFAIVTYPGSPLVTFQTKKALYGKEEGITKVYAWDAYSIRRPIPTQEQWPNYDPDRKRRY